MMWTVWVVSPISYHHSQCFMEVAQCLAACLKCEIVTDGHKCRGRTIVLGAHLLRPIDFLPDDLIIYNLEQLGEGCSWLSEHYLNLMRTYPVWDYSQSNITNLSLFGVSAKLCEVGYHECLSRVVKPEPDIDILFYGSINERRKTILDELAKHCRLHTAFGVYGAERDALISKSKIVLNMHYYPQKVFEIVRCSYLMANRVCVVSEGPAAEGYEDAIAWADYEGLTQRCLGLLKDDSERRAIANRGFEIFSGKSQAEILNGLR